MFSDLKRLRGSCIARIRRRQSQAKRKTLHFSLPIQYKRPNLSRGRGGIGRRAALRSLWGKTRGSSSLLGRTNGSGLFVSELDLELSSLDKMWYLLSFENLTKIPDIPWNETTKTINKHPITLRARFGSDLTDEEWSLVEPCLPPFDQERTPRKTDLREAVNAVRHMLVAGCQ